MTKKKSALKKPVKRVAKNPPGTNKSPAAKGFHGNEREKKHSKPFPIVAIGASAGGLEAITELLRNLPPDTGMAYVYIQHLDPSHKSMLSEILSRATKMPVNEATDAMFIEPDHVYIIPPNKEMFILDGVLKLNPRPNKPALSMPVNQFFRSLAEKQKEGAIGIVLSGTASDGALGLKAIKTAGGLTFAQDDSAKFQSMPHSAIAEGAVDLVLPPKEIAAELKRLSSEPQILKSVLLDGGENIDTSTREYDEILMLLKRSVGVDFTHYKQTTIKRRIVRRMLLYKLKGLKEYFQYLRQHTGEVNTLFQDLLIHVTSFFREPETAEYLEKEVLPKIIKTKLPNEPIRIWVPACSTGEEAYSLAILLMDILGNRISKFPVQIFATDLSETAIAKARLGLYSKADLAEASPRQLQKYFTPTDNSYRIAKDIRDLCVFAPHNIFKDPPFSRLDLVSCCNLMIYLDTVLQKKLLATFHYSLLPGGYMVLGKSETIGAMNNLFTVVDKQLKIYQRKKDSNPKAFFEMQYRAPDTDKMLKILPLPKDKIPNDPGRIFDLEKTVDNILLNRYVPASVVVNEDLEILQFRGSTGLFLEPSPGKASLNLLKMARKGISFELRNAFHTVQKTGEPFKKSAIEIKHRNAVHFASIEVVPLKVDPDEKYFLVLFEEMIVHPAAAITSASRDKRVKQLEQELLAAREDMRGIIEEQEASNEELQSANEEIVSSNEELQSINEELETSKEEVESTNEELLTINQEIQMRNDQLLESNRYAEELFNTIREGILVLDSHLRVKRVNQVFYRLFRVSPEETLDRLIYELGNHEWDIPRLRELLGEIIPHRTQIFDFEVEHTFPAIGRKVMLLNARKITEHNQQLILLAVQDITEHVMATRMLKENEMMFHSMADNAPVMIWMADTNKLRNFFNKTWLDYTGRKMEETVGTGWVHDVHKDDRDRLLNTYSAAFEKREPYTSEYRLRRHDGEYRWMLSSAKPYYRVGGEFSGFIGTVTEMHDQKLFTEELESKVQERTQELKQANLNLGRSNSELQQFAYVASHDLQEPLRKISIFSARLEKKMGKDASPDINDYLQRIISASNRLSKLIDALLNFSRATRMDKQFETVNLNTIVNDVLKDYDLLIAQKKAVIKTDTLPEVDAIPVQMAQLFHNLIGNALKFTKDSIPPQINITYRHFPNEDVRKYPRLPGKVNYGEIVIADNGIGFDMEFAEQIFIIFQRLHPKHTYAGTGIGLALCRKIAENHKGIIYAEGEENKGAAFHVILPVKK